MSKHNDNIKLWSQKPSVNVKHTPECSGNRDIAFHEIISNCAGCKKYKVIELKNNENIVLYCSPRIELEHAKNHLPHVVPKNYQCLKPPR